MKSNLLLNRSLAISMTHWRARALSTFCRRSSVSVLHRNVMVYGCVDRANAIEKLHRQSSPLRKWTRVRAITNTIRTTNDDQKKNKPTKIAFSKSNLSSSGCEQKFACVFWLTTAMSCASHTAQSALQNAETDLSQAIATNDGHTINWCMSTTRSHFISEFFSCAQIVCL